MEYSPTGSILHKDQLHQSCDRGEPVWDTRGKTTYEFDYRYEGEKPHAPSQIGDNAYTYDANGNQTGWQRIGGGNGKGQRRDILWDEENRIRAIAELRSLRSNREYLLNKLKHEQNGSTHHYMYDASGERVIKATGDGQAIYINGFPMGGSGTVGSYTMYVNPYMVVSNMNFTKHFYIEGQRIVSKLGEGGAYQYLLMDKNTQYVAGGDTINYDKKILRQKDAILASFEDLGLDGVVFTAGKSGKTPYGQLKKYYRQQNGNGATHVKDTTKATANANEKFRYFYHPDHLGSSSYITDASGEVYQHFEPTIGSSRTPFRIKQNGEQYFPFGERRSLRSPREHLLKILIGEQTFYEARSDHLRTPYLYNGKELDKETGLYYYGARYYDPRIGMWYGVDPMAEKYISMSPYIYVGNNPLVIKDEDGKDWTIEVVQNGKNTEVKITIDAAVYNSGSYINTQMVADALKSQMESTYSMVLPVINEKNHLNGGPKDVPVIAGIYSVTCNVNVRTINKKEDLKSNEHLVEIKASEDMQRTPGGRPALGTGEYYGKYITLNYDYISEMIYGDFATMAHEFGHTAGLIHPNDDTYFFGLFGGEQYLDENKDWRNLMFQTAIKQKHGGSGAENSLTKDQIEIIIRNYQEGKLNQ